MVRKLILSVSLLFSLLWANAQSNGVFNTLQVNQFLRLANSYQYKQIIDTAFVSNDSLYARIKGVNVLITKLFSPYVNVNINTSSPRDTIYFFGDSYTRGRDLASIYLRFSTTTAARMSLIEYNNGIDGSTMQNGTPSQPFGTPSMVERIDSIRHNSHSKYIVFAFGINDLRYNGGNYTPANFSAAYRQILDRTLSVGYAPSEIRLISPYYLSQYTAVGGNPAATTARHLEYNDTVKALGAYYNIPVIDEYTNGLKNGGRLLFYPNDSLHWGYGGHENIANDLLNSFGYTVTKDTQALAVNGVAEFQKIILRQTDSINGKFYPLGADSLGRVGWAANRLIENSLDSERVQNANININGLIRTQTNLYVNKLAWVQGGMDVTGFHTNRYGVSIQTTAAQIPEIDFYNNTGGTPTDANIGRNSVGTRLNFYNYVNAFTGNTRVEIMQGKFMSKQIGLFPSGPTFASWSNIKIPGLNTIDSLFKLGDPLTLLISNQTALQSGANFNIGGSGAVGTTFSTGGLDTYPYNFSGSFNSLTKVHKGYVDSLFATIGGGGAVASVSNSDASLTISPTTGAVVASINQGFTAAWTGFHTFTFVGTASGGRTRGMLIQPSLTAAANNDTLIGLSILPTYVPGAFTGTSSVALKHAGLILPYVNNSYTIGNASLSYSQIWSSLFVSPTALNLTANSSTQPINFNISSTKFWAIMPTTGNLIGQAGGSFTDITGISMQLNSATKAFLPNRWSTSQRNAISTIVEGGLGMNNETHKINYYDGTAWKTVADSGSFIANQYGSYETKRSQYDTAKLHTVIADTVKIGTQTPTSFPLAMDANKFAGGIGLYGTASKYNWLHQGTGSDTSKMYFDYVSNDVSANRGYLYFRNYTDINFSGAGNMYLTGLNISVLSGGVQANNGFSSNTDYSYYGGTSSTRNFGWLSRVTDNSNGNNGAIVTMTGQGSLSGASNALGAGYDFKQGISTGNASGTAYRWYTSIPGSSGTTDQTLARIMEILSTGETFLTNTLAVGKTSASVASAALEVVSTTQGLLPPRMTTAQRTAISSPAEGLMVYDLDIHKLYVYDGTTWQAAW